MQSADSFVRKDATASHGTSSSARRSFPQSQMRAIIVVVANVFGEQPLQMAFVHRDDMVQQIMPAALDPPFRHAILPRTLERCPDRSHVQGSNGHGNLKSVFAVSIKYQKTGSRSERECLPQLLNDPEACRMFGHVEVQDAPTIVTDHEEAVDHAEGDRRHREEVHRGNRFAMVPEEGHPSLRGLGISRRSLHPPGDRSLRDMKTEHEQFAVDAWRSPRRILTNHSKDQLAHCLWSGPSPDLPPHFRDQLPVHPEARSVPTDDRFRRHDDEC